MKVIAVVLILLHGPDGREIRINPQQVTSMRAASGDHNELLTDSVRCMVSLADGKYVSVVEPCETVQKMLEETR